MDLIPSMSAPLFRAGMVFVVGGLETTLEVLASHALARFDALRMEPRATFLVDLATRRVEVKGWGATADLLYAMGTTGSGVSA